MEKSVLEWFENSCSLYPEKIAFADEQEEITFSELHDAATRIGSHIAGFITKGSPVMVYMEKSVSAIKCFLGTVYGGGFYVLVDPSQPDTRVKLILDVLKPSVILTTNTYNERAKMLDVNNILILDEAQKSEVKEDVLNMIKERSTDIDPLYAIFTSGSTGIPKGVVVSHRSVLDFIGYYTDIFHITKDDIIGNQAPFDFDVSVKDIYSGIKTGAKVYIISKKLFSMPSKLLDCLCEQKVTVLTWAVSALCIISTLGGFKYKVPTTVQKVLFSGEVMPIKQLNIWRSYLPHAMFVNLYGPTEITCNCTYYIINKNFNEDEKLPLGKTFPNESVFLLDENNNLVTERNKLGELCVTGTALALGYYNNPSKTEEVFVQNPLNTKYHERMYRTGDLAYYDNVGSLYYSSRKDFQIKHMGHRIELGEVETVINGIPNIRRVCCIYHEKVKKIYAFFEGDLEKADLLKLLRDKLPQFMLPNVFIRLDSLPITANGKLDRQLLKKEAGID